jgi:hypothetical protein
MRRVVHEGQTPRPLQENLFLNRLRNDEIVVPSALSGDLHAVTNAHCLRIMKRVMQARPVSGGDEE